MTLEFQCITNSKHFNGKIQINHLAFGTSLERDICSHLTQAQLYIMPKSLTKWFLSLETLLSFIGRRHPATLCYICHTLVSPAVIYEAHKCNGAFLACQSASVSNMNISGARLATILRINCRLSFSQDLVNFNHPGTVLAFFFKY